MPNDSQTTISPDYQNQAERVARIMGDDSAAAAALRRQAQIRAAGGTGEIMLGKGVWLVKEDAP